MSRSDWSQRLTLTLAAASTFIFMLAVAFAIVSEQYVKIHQVYARYQQAAENDRSNAANEASRACVGTQPSALSQCIAEQIKAYDRKQATNQDLQAQQDMALWAFWAFFVSACGVLVTGIGIFFVWRTLEANRDAVNVAIESNKIARKIGEAQVRAYPLFTPKKINLLTLGNTDSAGKAKFGNRIGFIIEGPIKNTGQSPAKRVSIHIAVLQVDADKPFAPLKTLKLKETPPFSGDIGSGSASTQRARVEIDVDISRLISGKAKIRVAGKITYIDVFDTDATSALESYFDGTIHDVGAFIGHFNRTGSAAGAPQTEWEWAKHEDYNPENRKSDEGIEIT